MMKILTIAEQKEAKKEEVAQRVFSELDSNRDNKFVCSLILID